MSTWFAIHVKPGSEAQAVELLSSTGAQTGVEELFCPMSVFGHSDQGRLVEQELPTIPGCVVAVAPSKWEVRRALRGANGMQALYDGTSSFDALSDDEAKFIDQFTQPGNRTIPLSHGVVSGGRVSIDRGPLTGREGMVKRLNRRKSRAILDAHVAGVPVEAQLGLQVAREDDGAHGRRVEAHSMETGRCS